MGGGVLPPTVEMDDYYREFHIVVKSAAVVCMYRGPPIPPPPFRPQYQKAISESYSSDVLLRLVLTSLYKMSSWVTNVSNKQSSFNVYKRK